MMETNDSPAISPRSVKVAGRLSDLGLGFGQIYCGHFIRGLAFYAIAMLIVGAWAGLIVLMKGRFIQALAIGAVPAIALTLFARIDARRLAARAPADYRLKEYNHWYVYALLSLVMVSFAVCLAFVIREHAFEAFKVTSEAMSPAVNAGNRVLVNKTIYDVEPMQRGDLVVVRSVGRRRIALARRLIGLPGDKVELHGAELSVAAALDVTSQPATPPPPSLDARKARKAWTVPAGFGFFAKDNRSLTGQEGLIPLANVVGRVEAIYWPRPRAVK